MAAVEPEAPPNQLEHIEAEEGSDADSALGSEAATSTTSLASSVLDYVYENGRRYQRSRRGEDSMFPNDEQEQDRLDLVHHVYLLTQKGALFAAPIKNPKRALDIGTGTGLWALDFADQFPDCQVIGVDISPIQPNWVAPNCQFIVDDLEADWVYPEDKHFDYIHQRSMAGSIGDWPRLFRQVYDNLNPGGWFEIQEFMAWFYAQNTDGSGNDDLSEDTPLVKWQKLCDEASIKIGRRLNCAGDLPEPFKATGFTDVKHQVVKVPVGTWPKDKRLREMGQFLHVQMSQALDAVTLAYLTRVLKWSEQETQVFMAQVRNDFNARSKSMHLYTFMHYMYGKKPESA
ncbi:S-adenosyl-L-methionine-dependent methyltransferase [Lineolata rhizophorae]|uniref:S-adenosyl-L-methionine-dependent methyltransferase n=1 Tax=Lineolata rhizophorae TaxID=578093 RepID=A0A6A6P1N2_9PEZI|nr:S-adenosyl-L-methionine-dependent methyltransferase [Lineolata rhizophorae]